MLKFYWNGIKDNGGRLQRAFYSLGGLIPKYPAETITIFARDYDHFSAGVRAAFKVENDSDMMSDYFERDHIRVLPDHPLYSEVRGAYEAMMARRKRRYGQL
jgi:hypothetical protein